MKSNSTAKKLLWSKMEPWILASRPKTLSTCIVPILIPTTLAFKFGYYLKNWVPVFAFLIAICIQVATNLVNDALDYKKGADTPKRIGPVRVTQSGLLSSRQVLQAGIGFYIFAFCLGIPFIWLGGWVIGIILAICILSGYLYTGGPYPWSYLGLGDVFVLVFYGFVFTCTMYYLQTRTIDSYALVASLQCGLLATTLIAINNFRDIDEDSKTGKSTLAVRFGKKFARYEITLLIFIPFLLNLFWLDVGFSYAAIIPMLLMPLALKLVFAIWKTEPSPIYNSYLGQASLLNLLFGILFSMGIYLQ